MNPSSNRTKKLIFVTGTDTDVGKTVVSTVLLAHFRRLGYQVRGIKPVESGCERGSNGELIPADATALAKAAGHSIDCPFRFEAPLAPAAAAQLSSQPAFNLRTTLKHLEMACIANQLVIAEGAGGLLVPLTATHSMVDLVLSCRASLLVVARPGLGTINHTSLTLEAAARRQIPLIGFVFSAPQPLDPGRIIANAQAITAITQQRYLGCLGPIDALEQDHPTTIPQELISAIAANVNATSSPP